MRKFNFYPGPSTLPLPVLEAMQAEFMEYGNCGAGFIELSHRSSTVIACHERVIAALRELLQVDSSFHVLLLPGGSVGQSAAIPMNLLPPGKCAAYAVTGHWGDLAAKQAQAYGAIVRCVDTIPDGCRSIPSPESWTIPADCAFVHYTDNETIHGVEYPAPPAIAPIDDLDLDLDLDLVLVADQSSNILSRPYPTSKLGLSYACLQKNLGPSGLAVVIVRAELCGRCLPITPKIWNYEIQARSQSMANTIPTFQLRMLELMLEWIKSSGGTSALGELNRAKADRLYACIDESSFYANEVDPAVRSRMNVPFTLARSSREQDFLRQAEEAGLIGLKGHRAIGGMRASIYNAMPMAGVEALIDFMREFERRHA